MRSVWEFILCEGPNPNRPLDDLVEIGPLDSATSRKVTPVLNRAGGATFQIDLEDELAYWLYRHRQERGTVRSCVKCVRDGVTKWSGPVWTISGGLSTGKAQVNCVGWRQRNEKRAIHKDMDFSDKDLGQVLFAVMDQINSQDDHGLYVGKGPATGLTQRFNLRFERGKTLGEIERSFTDVENGVDLIVDPDTRLMTVRPWTEYNETSVHLGYGVGPGNLRDVSWQESADQTANRIEVAGGDGLIGLTDDPDGTAQDYGIFEESVSLTDVVGDDATQVLLGYGGAEYLVRSRPQITYTVVPMQPPRGSDGDRLFETFDIGDSLAFSAERGAWSVWDQRVRVFGATVAVDDQTGEETVESINIAPEGGS